MNEYGLDLKKWRATMMDSASTNKNAKSLIEAKTGVLPILILVFCISHVSCYGYSGCGKKHTTFACQVQKYLTKMIQFSMCITHSIPLCLVPLVSIQGRVVEFEGIN
jgi:hypothetical protein